MNQSLFRKSVLRQQGEKLWGSLIISQPVSYWLISFFLAGITFLALFFLISNDYHRKQAVLGYLVPDTGIVSISAPQGGLISKINVQQHDLISRGDIVFEVQVDRLVNADVYLTEKVLHSIIEQEKNLKEIIDLKRQSFENLIHLHESKNSNISLALVQLYSLFDTEQSLLKINLQAQQRAIYLHKNGYLSLADLEQVKSALLQQKNILQQLNLQVNETKFELLQLQNEKQSIVIENRNEINQAENELAELNKQKARLSAQNSNQVIAPVTGQVSSINVSSGQTVSSQQEVLALIPEGAELEAALYVPSRAIAFLAENQQVSIRYDAFPYQKFGVQKAQIISISKSVVLPSDLPTTLALTESVYLVKASLVKQSVSAFGNEMELKAGMMFSADVILEQRSLFEWLMEPLFSIKGRY